jgi:hypothetical protein
MMRIINNKTNDNSNDKTYDNSNDKTNDNDDEDFNEEDEQECKVASQIGTQDLLDYPIMVLSHMKKVNRGVI